MYTQAVDTFVSKITLDLVVDPGFPDRRDANPCFGGKNLLFDKIFTENCMKMKEIRPIEEEVNAPSAPPRSACNYILS